MTKTKIIINLSDPPSINGITSIQRKIRLKKYVAITFRLILEIGMALFTSKMAFNMADGANTLWSGLLWISLAAAYYASTREKLIGFARMCDQDINMLNYVSVDQEIKRQWAQKSMEAIYYMERVRQKGRPLTMVEAEMLEKLCKQEAKYG
ncbi:hypothetical protein [Acidithiobacillus sp.]|uniref:hypothetical protein n=1 Tax=Acidithiobacillus sp. TaxID=1872118 RepID=UPI002624DB24|nr:hypothetical protein [Acidithiobacillus sp.]MDD5278728.1 hypothetical protein [Acidithiobacillus sp.]